MKKNDPLYYTPPEEEIQYDHWDVKNCEQLIGAIIAHNGYYYAWYDFESLKFYCDMVGADASYIRKELRKIHPERTNERK
jgi:hypothetical protein